MLGMLIPLQFLTAKLGLVQCMMPNTCQKTLIKTLFSRKTTGKLSAYILLWQDVMNLVNAINCATPVSANEMMDKANKQWSSISMKIF